MTVSTSILVVAHGRAYKRHTDGTIHAGPAGDVIDPATLTPVPTHDVPTKVLEQLGIDVRTYHVTATVTIDGTLEVSHYDSEDVTGLNGEYEVAQREQVFLTVAATDERDVAARIAAHVGGDVYVTTIKPAV